MARHLLRDYFVQSSNTSSSTFIGSYLTTIFMRRVLGYSYVGDTNYPINAVGTMLISTADSTPTAATPTFAGGTRAGINLGSGKEFNISIPVATRNLTTFGSADTGRIIVVQSTANPQYNSGCFLITGFDTATNSYVVDFRSGTVLGGATFVTVNVTLPQTTINVSSTSGFPSSGTILVVSSNGTQTVTYTSTNGTQFLGCTGGTGAITGASTVNSLVTLPQTTLLVNSTTGFPSSGTLLVISSTGRQFITYTGTTATSFTGCSGGTGTVTGGITSSIGTGASPFVTTINTTIAAGSNGVSLPTSTINVASTTTATTSITASSNNVALPTGTINVASTTGFATSGTIYVNTNLGFQLVTYTGTTATTFTGCTGGSGFMATTNQVLAGYSPTGGIVYVTTSTGVQQVAYTATSGGNSFTGCTGGSGSMSTGGVVYYSPSVPRIEPSDSMNWYLYEKDGTASALLVQGTSNGNTNLQYRGNGTSTTPRIILQSPNALQWQVRICHETTNDSGVGTAPISSECALITFAPGFGGNASGDFAVGGPHLHAPLFYNSNSNNLQGGAVGFGDNVNIPGGASTLQYRITVVGDTDGYGVSVFGRRPGNATNPRSYFLTFGMCEVEALPLPPNKEARLYSIGSGNSIANGGQLNDVSWYPGTINGNGNTQGVSVLSAVGNFAVPVTTAVSLLSYATGASQQGGPIFDGSAGDTPWFGGVELFAVDVLNGGVFNTWNNSSIPNYGFPNLEGRFLGTIPHIREGRANFAEYSITADQVAQHMRRGIWLLWGGPPVVT
jgi:hypothetical protein